MNCISLNLAEHKLSAANLRCLEPYYTDNVTLLWENPGLETPYFPFHRGKLVAVMTNPRAMGSPAVFLVTA